MKKLVKARREKADAHEAIFLHDAELFEASNPSPKLPFRYSQAKALLKKDLDTAFKTGEFKKPKSLWKSRPEYQEFSLETFRSSYFSMKAKKIALPYWNVKRNKNAHRLHLEKAEKMNKEYDEWKLVNQMNKAFRYED